MPLKSLFIDAERTFNVAERTFNVAERRFSLGLATISLCSDILFP